MSFLLVFFQKRPIVLQTLPGLAGVVSRLFFFSFPPDALGISAYVDTSNSISRSCPDFVFSDGVESNAWDPFCEY